MSLLNDKEIPIGLGMALAQNLDAMNYFSHLNETDQDQIIKECEQIQSKKEMQSLVSKMGTFY